MESAVVKPTAKLILPRFAKDVRSLLPVGAVEKGFKANLGSVGAVDEKEFATGP